jgi:undecaprenyl pyrophosphate synthase
MPGLTVTEKEHWKDRIAKRIDRQIDRITAQQPTIIETVRREAKQRAMVALGLHDLQIELDQVEAEKQILEKRELRLQRAMVAKVRGLPIEEVSEDSWYRFEQEVSAAVERRKSLLEDELLAEHEVGRRILDLRQEREGLLDCVWLATSSKSIKELWTKVAELLGDEQTRLQRDALAIDPVEE